MLSIIAVILIALIRLAIPVIVVITLGETIKNRSAAYS
jgi:hypothetical protein